MVNPDFCLSATFHCEIKNSQSQVCSISEITTVKYNVVGLLTKIPFGR